MNAADSMIREQQTVAESGRRLRVLSVSSLFPTEGQPQAGVFVQRRLQALSELADVQVVRPIPWFPGYQGCGPSRRSLQNGLPVHDRAMFYFPLVLKHWDSMWMQRCLEPFLRRQLEIAPFDLIDAHFGYPTGVGCMNVAERLGIPVFVTLRGVEQEEFLHHRIGPQIVKALNECAGVIAVGQSLKTAAVRAGVSEQRIRVIPNAVDRNRFRPGDRVESRKQLGISRDEELIVSVGSLCRVKRHHVLVEAFRKVHATRPQARLVIVGGKVHEAGYATKTSRMIRRLDLAKFVRLVGGVEPAEVVKWLHAANVFALATAREGSCNAVLEALACGVPVVSTAVADHKELLAPPRRVLIVPVVITIVWMGVFGGTGLHLEMTQGVGLAAAVEQNITTALFRLFDLLPLSSILSVLGIILIFIFLITSADSASYIVAQMTDRGSIDPPLVKRLTWGGLIAAICLTLIATGGLEGLQAGVVLAALPFTFILYAMVWRLFRELAADRRAALEALYHKHRETPVAATIEEAQRLGD